MRDDFKKDVKETLAKRVGLRCSNPNCRMLTSGPQIAFDKSINIGVAAHITAASPGGPRYDSKISKLERTSIENGIWLCQNCGTLIDSDPQQFTADLLIEWKRLSEQAASLEVKAVQSGVKSAVEDVELIRFYSQCLDRPAFQDMFRQEGSMEAFDTAISDTITAINTGNLRSRDGQTLFQSKGKSFLVDPEWRKKMDTIVDLLRAIRSQYDLAIQNGQIHLGYKTEKEQFYILYDAALGEWMDSTRGEIIRIFSEICEEARIPPLYFPRPYPTLGAW